MTRRRFRWNPETDEFDEIGGAALAASVGPMVHGDFKPVNVGGVVIEERGHLRRYLKANGLVHHDDAKVVAKKAREAIAARHERERVQTISDSYERVRDETRARSRYG